MISGDNSKRILVVGGAGYIGSHMVKLLLHAGYETVILDNSKWMVEQALAGYDHAFGLKSVCLRYFNAAGADPEGELGERHEPETHLIPLLLQAASGRRAEIAVFGRDYDTPDGTCIRDYVHVADLCQAHLLALHALSAGAQSDAFNLGNGSGFSVQEVIDAARRVTGRNIAIKESPRRPGDAARLVANSARAKNLLGWEPAFSSLDLIVRHAWHWEQKMCAQPRPFNTTEN